MTEEIHVFDCGGYWTVCNKLSQASPRNHSHFWVRKAAYTLKSLIEDKVVPYSPYMIESALRVSIDDYYRSCIMDEYGIPHNIDIFSKDAIIIIEKSVDCNK